MLLIFSLPSSTVVGEMILDATDLLHALGKGKVCFICKGKPHIASDLQGITYVDGDLGDAQMKTRLKSWVDRVNGNIK